MSWKTPGQVRARTRGTKSPSRSEALRFIDSAKSQPQTVETFSGPIEEVIGESFLPQLLGWEFSAEERQLFALPVKFAGLDITDPTTTAHADWRLCEKLLTTWARPFKVGSRWISGHIGRLFWRPGASIEFFAKRKALLFWVKSLHHFQSPSGVLCAEQLTTLFERGYRWPPASRTMLLCHRENSEMELRCGTRNLWYKCHVFVMDVGLNSQSITGLIVPRVALLSNAITRSVMWLANLHQWHIHMSCLSP